ncbi:MAG: alpha/beta hydrolase [Chthoniobacteraceae bacterium]
MKTICPALVAVLLGVRLCTAAENGAKVSEQSSVAVRPSPPKQPASGPGGSDYAHHSVKQTEHGEEGQQYWIIEPAQPAPKRAPLVIFLHGWSAMTPDTYRGWVNHLAKRGNIVVYPRYQARLFSPATEFFPNVVASVRAALEVLAQPGHVTPDLGRVAVVGHSAGGVEAANYAVLAASEKLPAPKAAMIVEPGQGKDGGLKIIPMEDCGKFPASLKLIVMIGDADGLVGEGCARTIWRDAKHVRDRAFVTLRSDAHGMPSLNANHLAPISWSRLATDALDWLGYWRTFDALMNAAFSGKPLVVDPSMSAWSDGVAVTPMKVER